MNKRQVPARERPLFEELEPRILYSADAVALFHPDALAPSAEVRVLDFSSPSPNQTTAAQTAITTREIVFVDTRVSNYQQLIDDIKAGEDANRKIDIAILDANQNGIAQITEILSHYSNLDAVHLISHGGAGMEQLGSTWLDSTELDTYKDEIATWKTALSENADILLYGCDVAANESGQYLVIKLAELTDADVAASTNLTGAASLGGDWVLEYTHGGIQASSVGEALVQSNWNGLLATATFQQGVSSYAGTTDTYIDSGATAANNGATTDILASASGSQQGLISFDVSTIPAGSTITSVQLNLVSSINIGLLPSINLYAMIATWGSAANWNSFGGGGINHDGSDAASSSDANFLSLLTLGGTASFSSAAMATTVQSWLNNPSINHGWLIQGGGLANTNFYSSDSGTASDHPQLLITYTAPTPPSFDLDANNSSGASGSNYTTSFIENGPIVAVADIDATVTAGTNSISPNLSAMTISISNLLDGTAEVLAATTTGTNITASYNSSTGVLALSGADTAANYQTVLRTVTYNNTSNTPTTTSRVINVVATDPYGGNSTTATTTIAVTAVNDAPVASAYAISGLEDATGIAVNLTGTDVDGTIASVNVSSLPLAAAGVLYLADGTTAVTTAMVLTPVQAAALIFTPTLNFNGSVSIPFTVTDELGLVSAAAANAAITVTSVNDAPTTTPVTLTSIVEDSAVRLITQAELLANASDVDGPALTAIGLTISSGAGSLVDNGNGTWSYSPALNDDTALSLSYTVSDGSLTAAGSAALDITTLNDAPINPILPLPWYLLPGAPISGTEPSSINPGPDTSPITQPPPPVGGSSPEKTRDTSYPSSQTSSASNEVAFIKTIETLDRYISTGTNSFGTVTNLDNTSTMYTSRTARHFDSRPATFQIQKPIELPAKGNLDLSSGYGALFNGITPETSIQVENIDFLGSNASPNQDISQLILDHKVALSIVAISVSLASWAARYSALFLSVLATIPAWRNLDPVAILSKDHEDDPEWNMSEVEMEESAEESAADIWSEKTGTNSNRDLV